jgi:hypothetical protein
MQTWVELVQNNVGSIELDADQFNFGAMPEEEEHIEVVAEASPPLKMGNKNKKRSRNFSEKEDMLLASAWLEISLNLVQNIDQTRNTYGHRIHEYYNKHKTFDSDRNVSSLSLSLIVGVSFKQVLANFVHGTIKYSVQIKVMSLIKTKTRYKVLPCCMLCLCFSICMHVVSMFTNTLSSVHIQQTCVLYKDHDPDNKSFGLLHCWNLLKHAQKWKDLPCNNSNKKQNTASKASPRSATLGTHEGRHIDEEDGPSHTSPTKASRPDGRKKEKQRRGKNPIAHGELYLEAVEYSWSKREKTDEIKELRKKEHNDERLALENKGLK